MIPNPSPQRLSQLSSQRASIMPRSIADRPALPRRSRSISILPTATPDRRMTSQAIPRPFALSGNPNLAVQLQK
jgi:hypothetical protein